MAAAVRSARAFKEQTRATRRLIRKLPDQMRDEILAIYRDEGPVIEAFGRQNAPVRTGRLRQAIKFRVLPRTLNAQFGIIGRRLNREVFYARILEFGRKGGQSRAFRRKLRNGDYTRRYTVRVSPISRDRYDFVFGRARRFVVERLRPKLNKAWERALRNLSGV